MKEWFLGKNILYYFKLNGLNQEKGAKEMGITKSTMNNYINGKTEMTYELLEKFSKKLGVTIDDLFFMDLEKLNNPELLNINEPPPQYEKNHTADDDVKIKVKEINTNEEAFRFIIEEQKKEIEKLRQWIDKLLDKK